MTREQVEHVLRAAAGVTNENVFLVFGSQSIHGSIQAPPPELTMSRELDIFPVKAPEKMELINGSIGEISPFDRKFGYYAHGIPPDTCPLPRDWDKRLQPIRSENTNEATGLCLSVPDLACSKLAEGREKDFAFVGELLLDRFCTAAQLAEFVPKLPRKEQRDQAEVSWQIVASRVLRDPKCVPGIRGEIQTGKELTEPEPGP